MQNTQTYFGIRFTSEFPAGKKDRFRLAKVLFSNPATSPQDAFRMLSNIDLWPLIDALISRLEQEADKWKKGRSPAEIESGFQKKVNEWVKFYSFPSLDELESVANELEISSSGIIEFILDQVQYLPPSSIMDFLKKYKKVIRENQVNVILDHYNDARRGYGKGDGQMRLKEGIQEML
ncbi:MAG TPA: hypothetical protein PKH94_09175 [Bacteroidales bacterium]|nr:hypothetical protein [Bacteroidales bacterium]HNS47397.1 hypothetical protein [Bacteroidales bacterium]